MGGRGASASRKSGKASDYEIRASKQRMSTFIEDYAPAYVNDKEGLQYFKESGLRAEADKHLNQFVEDVRVFVPNAKKQDVLKALEYGVNNPKKGSHYPETSAMVEYLGGDING